VVDCGIAGLRSSATLSIESLAQNMEEHGLEKVTVRIVKVGTMPEMEWPHEETPLVEWPFEETMQTVREDEFLWDSLKGVTIRHWYLERPCDFPCLEFLTHDCKDDIFNLSASPESAADQPSFAATLVSATTKVSVYEQLLSLLKEYDTESSEE
jgi:hypothetical protein